MIRRDLTKYLYVFELAPVTCSSRQLSNKLNSHLIFNPPLKYYPYFNNSRGNFRNKCLREPLRPLGRGKSNKPSGSNFNADCQTEREL